MKKGYLPRNRFMERRIRCTKESETFKMIGYKLAFNIKDEVNGFRYKSSLCTKGYGQTDGIDYTFTPII